MLLPDFILLCDLKFLHSLRHPHPYTDTKWQELSFGAGDVWVLPCIGERGRAPVLPTMEEGQE